MSARKRTALLVLGCTAFVTIVILRQLAQNKDMLLLKSGNKRYGLAVASTAAERMLGLGRRASLPDSQGMLFVFSRPAEQCFWMKDMQFSLDIIWLSSGKRVEQVMTDVSPNTYPQTFCPPSPAEYVIELNAGQVKQAGIYIGETLKF